MTENNYGFEDLDNVCRLCLSTTTLVSIFDDRFESTEDWSMRDVVEVTTGVKISPNDGVSHKLCNKCSHLIIRIFKFRNASMMNDLELKEKLSRRNMHKSVEDLLKQNPKLIVPSSICGCDMSPVVILDRNVSDHLKRVKIKSLKRRIFRDEQTKMIPKKEENVPKKFKSAVEPRTSSENVTVQQSPEYLSGNVFLSAEKLIPLDPHPVGDIVRQQMDQKREDEDKKSPLFTIKTITKSTFICDMCNKVHYNTKELKKHRATHMRCSLCRTSFTSMEETQKHGTICSIKKIISNPPRLRIERCEEIHDIREKYSEAFRNSLIIEISDDESGPAKDKSLERNFDKTNELNKETKEETSSPDVDRIFESKGLSIVVDNEGIEKATRKISKKHSTSEKANKVSKETNGKKFIEKLGKLSNFGGHKKCSDNFEKSKKVLNFNNNEAVVPCNEICKPSSSKNSVKLKLIDNFSRISMNIVSEYTDHNSDGHNEISELDGSKEESEMCKRISIPKGSHLEKSDNLVNLSDSSGPETSKGTSEIISHVENNQNREKSSLDEFKETKQPETLRKSNTEDSKIIPQMQNMYNAEQSNVEKSENTKVLQNKICTHLENTLNPENSNVDKFKEFKQPETSEGKSNTENNKMISQMETILNTESNVEESEENGLESTQTKYNLDSSEKTHHIKNKHQLENSNVEKSTKNELDMSEQNSNPKKSISLEESEELNISNLNIEKIKEIIGLKESGEISNPYIFKTVSNLESEISNVEKSVVMDNSQTSEGESSPVKSNTVQAKEIIGGKFIRKSNPEKFESTDELSNSEMKSNPQDSGTVSSLGKSEKVLVLDKMAGNSEGINNSKKYKEPSNSEIKELSIKLKRICPSPKPAEVSRTERSNEPSNKANESAIHIKILKPSVNSKQVHKPENGTQKRKRKKEDHSKYSKKLKRFEATETSPALNHEKKNNLTMGNDNDSTTNNNSFKPDISFGEIDCLEVEDVDDDNTFLKNLLQRMKTSESQVNKSVQTSLPSNSDIMNMKGETFIYELKNLRSYLNFTQIPVNISYAKIPTIKYTYESSSLKNNQEKLKNLKSKQTSSVQNRKLILIHPRHNKQTKKQSESSLAPKEIGSESSNVPTQQTSFESNFRIESVMTVSAKDAANKISDKININVPSNENIQVYSTNTHPRSVQTTAKIDEKINTNVQLIENTQVYSTTTNPKSVSLDTKAINIETPNQESNRFNPTTTSNCIPGNEGYLNTIISPQIINIANSVVPNNTTIPFISYSMSNIPVQNSMIAGTQYYLLNNSVQNGMVANPVTMITAAPAQSSNAQTLEAKSQNMNSNVNPSVSLPNTRFTPTSTPRLPPPLHQIRFKPSTPTSRQTSVTGASLLHSRLTTDILPETKAKVTPCVPQSISAVDSPSTATQMNPSNQVFIAPRAPPLHRLPSALSRIRIVPRIPSTNSAKLNYTKTTKDPSDCDKLEEKKSGNECSNHVMPVSSGTRKYIRVKNLAELK